MVLARYQGLESKAGASSAGVAAPDAAAPATNKASAAPASCGPPPTTPTKAEASPATPPQAALIGMAKKVPALNKGLCEQDKTDATLERNAHINQFQWMEEQPGHLQEGWGLVASFFDQPLCLQRASNTPKSDGTMTWPATYTRMYKIPDTFQKQWLVANTPISLVTIDKIEEKCCDNLNKIFHMTTGTDPNGVFPLFLRDRELLAKALTANKNRLGERITCSWIMKYVADDGTIDETSHNPWIYNFKRDDEGLVTTVIHAPTGAEAEVPECYKVQGVHWKIKDSYSDAFCHLKYKDLNPIYVSTFFDADAGPNTVLFDKNCSQLKKTYDKLLQHQIAFDALQAQETLAKAAPSSSRSLENQKKRRADALKSARVKADAKKQAGKEAEYKEVPGFSQD